MSNRPKTKETFWTPIDVVNDLLMLGVLRGVSSILEPCAGTGNIVKAIRKIGYDHHITAIEIEEDFIEDLCLTKPTTLINKDFFDPSLTIGKFDLVIINPPYTMIEAFIERSLENCLHENGQLAVLLRLAHLVGVGRGKFLSKYQPSQVHLLTHRPAFTGGPGDIGGHCWAIWDWPTKQTTTLDWIRPVNGISDRRVNNGSFKKIRGLT